jgi:hypothetical protein
LVCKHDSLTNTAQPAINEHLPPLVGLGTTTSCFSSNNQYQDIDGKPKPALLSFWCYKFGGFLYLTLTQVKGKREKKEQQILQDASICTAFIIRGKKYTLQWNYNMPYMHFTSIGWKWRNKKIIIMMMIWKHTGEEHTRKGFKFKQLQHPTKQPLLQLKAYGPSMEFT